MKNNRFDFQAVGKTKLLLVVIFLTAAVILWINFCFFKSQEIEVIEQQREMTTKNDSVQQGGNSQSAVRVNLEQIYGNQVDNRDNPFSFKKIAAPFTYQSNKARETINIAESNLELRLLGVINRAEQRTAIVDYQGQSYFLKVGEELAGFKVEKISDNKLELLKQGERYFTAIVVGSQ
ncbi:MAG: type II secretion system protein N [Bacillota bacterium]